MVSEQQLHSSIVVPPRRASFSLQTMFASVALVAVGFAMIAQAGDLGYPGSAVAGAGALLPVKRPILGATVGFSAFIMFLLVVFCLYGFEDAIAL
jgi:hypothetical protein